jgi:hypothetical protein
MPSAATVKGGTKGVGMREEPLLLPSEVSRILRSSSVESTLKELMFSNGSESGNESWGATWGKKGEGIRGEACGSVGTFPSGVVFPNIGSEGLEVELASAVDREGEVFLTIGFGGRTNFSLSTGKGEIEKLKGVGLANER